MIHQADLIFEREIARNTTVSASYLFSLGTKSADLRRPQPRRPDRRPQTFRVIGGPLDGQTLHDSALPDGASESPSFAQITEIQSSVKSQYNALVLQAQPPPDQRPPVPRQLHALEGDRQQPDVADLHAEQRSLQRLRPGPGAWDIELRRAPQVRRQRGARSAIRADNAFVRATPRRLDDRANLSSTTRAAPTTASSRAAAAARGSLNRSGGANRIPLVERNAFRQPEIRNVDLRLSRRFHITEDQRRDPR